MTTKNYIKKTIAAIAICAGMIFMIISCSKDDKEPSYSLKYDGKTYNLVSYELQDYGDYYNNGTYSYGIALITDQNDCAVEIDILLENEDFPQGSRTFNYSTSHAAGTMDAFFYVFENDTNGNNGKIKSGTATISLSGNTYDISFNVTLNNDKTVSGHYKAKFTD
jgi:predicted heme/steroid binding protein